MKTVLSLFTKWKIKHRNLLKKSCVFAKELCVGFLYIRRHKLLDNKDGEQWILNVKINLKHPLIGQNENSLVTFL